MTESLLNIPKGVELCPIRGFIGYAAGSDGQIYSFRVSRAPKRRRFSMTARNLKPFEGARGYLQVHLYPMGTRRKLRHVHRLVASSFHGQCPSGMECSHINGDKLDNRPDNLVWETRGDNFRRKAEHGTVPRGENTSAAKLKEVEAFNIRRRRLGGERGVDLAKEFGVSQSTICDIRYGRKWKHLQEEGVS